MIHLNGMTSAERIFLCNDDISNVSTDHSVSPGFHTKLKCLCFHFTV